eukprot:scaffold7480_cov430-Prasinococcus_capsulatus_cf.AAC.6
MFGVGTCAGEEWKAMSFQPLQKRHEARRRRQRSRQCPVAKASPVQILDVVRQRVPWGSYTSSTMIKRMFVGFRLGAWLALSPEGSDGAL